MLTRLPIVFSGVLLVLAPGLACAGEIRAVAITPDGKTVAACDSEKTVCLWELASGKLLKTITGEVETETLAFSPEGKTLAVATHTSDGSIALYSVPDGKVTANV